MDEKRRIAFASTSNAGFVLKIMRQSSIYAKDNIPRNVRDSSPRH